jgi:hypothetical protein
MIFSRAITTIAPRRITMPDTLQEMSFIGNLLEIETDCSPDETGEYHHLVYIKIKLDPGSKALLPPRFSPPGTTVVWECDKVVVDDGPLAERLLRASCWLPEGARLKVVGCIQPIVHDGQVWGALIRASEIYHYTQNERPLSQLQEPSPSRVYQSLIQIPAFQPIFRFLARFRTRSEPQGPFVI